MSHNTSRRTFLKASAATAGAASVPMWFPTPVANAQGSDSPNERHVLGCIGTGSRWRAVGPAAMNFADCVALCDADTEYGLGMAKKRTEDKQKGKKIDLALYEDYRKILDDPKIDVVTIVTPDHWHTKIAVEAMQAGKDVYCEKPLTLTIEEGKQIRKVQDETGRTFQVGTQQRSEMGMRFLKAVALVHAGRLGEIKTVQCSIGAPPAKGPFKSTEPPPQLNWDLWQGQTPDVPYIKDRVHYEFRWWYEYSGGKMTDWGAHHVDIAQWMIQQTDTGPTELEPLKVTHPVEMKDGYPTRDDMYNTATEFLVRVQFPNGVVMGIRHDQSNGIRIRGDKGELFVSRGKLILGEGVKSIEDEPLPEGLLTELYKGKTPQGNHMQNFFQCIDEGGETVSDVKSHHRAMTTCHLANIALRLNRTIKWDPEAEHIVGDDEAASFERRDQRSGYEINVEV